MVTISPDKREVQVGCVVYSVQITALGDPPPGVYRWTSGGSVTLRSVKHWNEWISGVEGERWGILASPVPKSLGCSMFHNVTHREQVWGRMSHLPHPHSALQVQKGSRKGPRTQRCIEQSLPGVSPALPAKQEIISCNQQKRSWQRSPMTTISQMGPWGWEQACGGAQGCQVTAHREAVSGPDGEYWRTITVPGAGGCYMVRRRLWSRNAICKSYNLPRLVGHLIFYTRNRRLQEGKSTGPVLESGPLESPRLQSGIPTLSGSWGSSMDKRLDKL